jgi:RimJ/RimL family protein N-acetyltransferase
MTKVLVLGADGQIARLAVQMLADQDTELTEIGWMVLPEFQGRGLGKRAVRMPLEMARDGVINPAADLA